jgi:pentatricopeptide repeat protein
VRNNQVEAVEGLLKDMKARGLAPNLITYSTVIKGVCQKGDMDAAFSVFKDLKKASAVKPDEIVYNTMLDGCATAGLVSEGEQLLEGMLKDGLAPTNYTLTVLVRLMGQGHRVQSAFDVIETFAHKHKVRANSHVYTALIQACLTCRDLSRAATAFEQALRSKVQPDQRVCQSFIRAFISSGNAAYAVGVLRALLGLSGSHLPTLPKNCQNSSTINDGFINETISCLLESGSDVRALAPPLVADIRAVRPKLRLEPSTERSLALTVARHHSNSSVSSSSDGGSPQKRHPWRQ